MSKSASGDNAIISTIHPLDDDAESISVGEFVDDQHPNPRLELSGQLSLRPKYTLLEDIVADGTVQKQSIVESLREISPETPPNDGNDEPVESLTCRRPRCVFSGCQFLTLSHFAEHQEVCPAIFLRQDSGAPKLAPISEQFLDSLRTLSTLNCVCGARYACQSSFNKHLELASNAVPWDCTNVTAWRCTNDDCAYSSPTQPGAVLHELFNHDKIYPYMCHARDCEHFGVKLGLKDALDKHMADCHTYQVHRQIPTQVRLRSPTCTNAKGENVTYLKRPSSTITLAEPNTDRRSASKRLYCTAKRCPRYRWPFASQKRFRQHLRSLDHYEAVREISKQVDTLDSVEDSRPT